MLQEIGKPFQTLAIQTFYQYNERQGSVALKVKATGCKKGSEEGGLHCVYKDRAQQKVMLV